MQGQSAASNYAENDDCFCNNSFAFSNNIMRRPIKKRPVVTPDIQFGSVDVERFINYIMLDGKKETARKIVYGAFEIMKNDKETGDDPLETFSTALRNAGPLMEVRSRRVGGANYQVPREVRPERRQALAYRWIIAAARKQKGSTMQKNAKNFCLQPKKKEMQ